MKKNLKLEKIIKLLLIILIIVLIVVIFFTIDYSRALKGKRPIFCIKNPAGVVEDGGTIEYYGLGYKIIDFNRLDGYDKTKVGLWSMKYEDFKEEYEGQDENMKYTISAVIMKVNDKTLEVVNIENNDIYVVNIPENTNEKYKKEQEILIYFNGIVEDLFPARIIHVGKIEIKKEKSDAIIPENILTTYYNTINNSQGD